MSATNTSANFVSVKKIITENDAALHNRQSLGTSTSFRYYLSAVPSPAMGQWGMCPPNDFQLV